MRRKLVSSLLCMMMMCTVCTPAYADETVTADTSVTTEVVATESTTAAATTTAAQKKVQKVDKKAKQTKRKHLRILIKKIHPLFRKPPKRRSLLL